MVQQDLEYYQRLVEERNKEIELLKETGDGRRISSVFNE